MKFSIFTVVLVTLTFFLVACDEKPAQYPPSLYDDRDGLLTDEELAAEKAYPSGTDDPEVPHAKSDEEEAAELAEESYPSGTDDPEVPHDKSDEEEAAELAEGSYPAGTDDPEVPHDKSDEEEAAELAEESYPADDPTLDE